MEACEEVNMKKIPKLPLLKYSSPERSGTKTPPLHISASVSVPFGWEEEPGKPKPCTDLVTFSNPLKCLELPPRLFFDTTKVPSHSPTTVYFDGPFKKDSCESGKLGRLILKEEMGVKKKGFFGNWRKKDIKVKKHVFLSSSIHKECEDEIISSDKNVKKIKHYGSFDNPFHANSPVWTKMCDGWKRVIPWKSENVNKYYQCWWL